MSTINATLPFAIKTTHFTNFLTELYSRADEGDLASWTAFASESSEDRKKISDYGAPEISSALERHYEALQNGDALGFCNRPIKAYSTDGRWRVQRTHLNFQDAVATDDILHRGRLSVGYTQFWHPRPGAVDMCHHLVMTDAANSIIGLLDGPNGLLMAPGNHNTLVTGLYYFLTPMPLRFPGLSSKSRLADIARWLFEQQFGASTPIRESRNESETPQWVEDTAQMLGGVFITPFTPSFAPNGPTFLLVGIANYTGKMLPLRRPLWPDLRNDYESVTLRLPIHSNNPGIFVTLQKDINRAIAALIAKRHADISNDKVQTSEGFKNLTRMQDVLSD